MVQIGESNYDGFDKQFEKNKVLFKLKKEDPEEYVSNTKEVENKYCCLVLLYNRK